MLNFKNVLAAVLVVVLLVLGRASWNGYLKNKVSGESLEETERELADLKQRSAYLEGEITRLQSPRGVEEAIRAKFQVAREGENVLVLVDPPTPTTTPHAKISFWSRIVSFFTRD